MKDIEAILKSIRPECNFAGVHDFFARGMLDSLDLTLLVSALEENYSITIDGADIVPENFQNVASILSLLTKYRIDVASVTGHS